MAKIFSTEDGNLSTSVRVVRDRLYSDFDLSFAAKTTTDGDIYKKTDAAAVKQSIKTLLLTRRSEKPFRPQFGADLYSLLFSLADESSGAEIADAIKSAIQRYEPRVAILRLKVTSDTDYNSADVTIEFRIVNTDIVDVIKVSLNDQTFVGASIPVVPPITPDQVFNNILLRTPEFERMLTEAGLLIARDIGRTVDGAILTQDGDELSILDGSGDVLIINGLIL
jgi:phage baseplate assembly protein W|tara:strand:+ start:1244 stop:1915 length:672 start_codon:yes stop_codon:yes gene_type:complete